MVKKLFKSVHIYQSDRQNKPGGPFFGPHGIIQNNKYIRLYASVIMHKQVSKQF